VLWHCCFELDLSALTAIEWASYIKVWCNSRCQLCMFAAVASWDGGSSLLKNPNFEGNLEAKFKLWESIIFLVRNSQLSVGILLEICSTLECNFLRHLLFLSHDAAVAKWLIPKLLLIHAWYQYFYKLHVWILSRYAAAYEISNSSVSSSDKANVIWLIN